MSSQSPSMFDLYYLLKCYYPTVKEVNAEPLSQDELLAWAAMRDRPDWILDEDNLKRMLLANRSEFIEDVSIRAERDPVQEETPVEIAAFSDTSQSRRQRENLLLRFPGLKDWFKTALMDSAGTINLVASPDAPEKIAVVFLDEDEKVIELSVGEQDEPSLVCYFERSGRGQVSLRLNDRKLAFIRLWDQRDIEDVLSDEME